MKRIILFRILPVIGIIILGFMFLIQVTAFIAAGHVQEIIVYDVMFRFVVFEVIGIVLLALLMKIKKI